MEGMGWRTVKSGTEPLRVLLLLFNYVMNVIIHSTTVFNICDVYVYTTSVCSPCIKKKKKNIFAVYAK